MTAPGKSWHRAVHPAAFEKLQSEEMDIESKNCSACLKLKTVIPAKIQRKLLASKLFGD